MQGDSTTGNSSLSGAEGGSRSNSISSRSNANDEASLAVAQVAGDSFKLVYTCKRCDTRNMIEVKRVSWNEGIVIATCQGCNAKHLIADNTGLLDLGGFTNFTNAVEELINRGEEVNRVHIDGPMQGDDGAAQSRLSDFDMAIDPDDGSVQLMPRPGDENIVRKDRVSAVGPIVDPSLVVDDIQGVKSATVTAPKDDESSTDATAGGEVGARMDSYAGGGAMVVDLPPGAEPGDLLQLSIGSDTGGGRRSGQIMMLPVPEGAEAEGKVEILGAIEFMVPDGKKEGDVLLLQTPSGEEIAIGIPPGVSEGSFLQVGYPAKPIIVKSDSDGTS